MGESKSYQKEGTAAVEPPAVGVGGSSSPPPHGDHNNGECASLLYESEMKAREKACTNSLYLVVANFISTIILFIWHLVSIEMIVSVGLTVGMTVYTYDRKKDDPDFDGAGMNTTLLTFAVVSPITLTISLAFRRREDALLAVADLRATLSQMYNAHSFWDWDFKPGDGENTGRTKSTVDWQAHADEACTEILIISQNMCRFLTLPNYNRARHMATPLGAREARRTKEVAERLYKSVLVHIGRLGMLCEILKREGLPPNEATRIRQYERYVQYDTERLRNIKNYRTPQALRSFGRIFSILLPPFYAPFFAEMGVMLEHLSVGIIFAALTSIALTGLFETVSQFEDPFIESSVLDGVNVEKELVNDFKEELLELRRDFFPGAAEFIAHPFSSSVSRATDELPRESELELLAQLRLINNQ